VSTITTLLILLIKAPKMARPTENQGCSLDGISIEVEPFHQIWCLLALQQPTSFRFCSFISSSSAEDKEFLSRWLVFNNKI